MKPKDYIIDIDQNAERRFLEIKPEIETRNEDDKEVMKITGYAAVFNRETDLGWFREVIDPAAFNESDMTQTYALFNHDPNQVLGRNGVNMTLSVDATGLRYDIDLPDTERGEEIYKLIKSGIINKSSFGFTIEKEEWDYETDTRRITRVKKLYDVSPVTYPAYNDTSVAARSKKVEQPKTNKNYFNKLKSKLF